MDFGGQATRVFKIDILVGLDIIAALRASGTCGEGDIPTRRVDNIIFIKLGDKHLPFGTAKLSSSPRRRNNRTLLTLAGPANARTALLDVI